MKIRMKSAPPEMGSQHSASRVSNSGANIPNSTDPQSLALVDFPPVVHLSPVPATEANKGAAADLRVAFCAGKGNSFGTEEKHRETQRLHDRFQFVFGQFNTENF